MIHNTLNTKKLVFFLIVFFGVLFFAKTSSAATINAVSCSNEDVQAAINSASDGDTVEVPACPAGVHWDDGYQPPGLSRCYAPAWACAGVQIPSTKGIILKGQGIGQTVIITDIAIAIWADQTSESTSQIQITGFDFRPGTGHTEQGVIVIRGKAKDWRVHHNQFGTASTPFPHRQFWIGHVYGDCTYGLWDHNTHYGSSGTGNVAFGGCNGGVNYGDKVWQTPLNWGGSDWMFFEDNTFHCTTSSYGRGCGAPDNTSAARIVYRYNWTDGGFCVTHGAESSGRSRGVRALDVYNNTVVNQIDDHHGLCGIRAGTARVHDNSISGVSYQRMGAIWLANWDNSRGAPYGNCRDAPAEGLCSGNYETACTVNSDCSVAGGTCQWVHDVPGSVGGEGDGNGYPCRDQPGRGLDTGVTTPQAVEPIYSWANSGPNTNLAATTGGVLENRDFYNCSSYQDCVNKGMPVYVTYQYPHPLQSGGAPADTTPPQAPTGVVVS